MLYVDDDARLRGGGAALTRRESDGAAVETLRGTA